jgi:hypothetical protein
MWIALALGVPLFAVAALLYTTWAEQRLLDEIEERQSGAPDKPARSRRNPLWVWEDLTSR